MTLIKYPFNVSVGHDYGPNPTRPHGPHLVTEPPAVVSDPKSHNLETDRREVFRPIRLEPPDRDIWHDLIPPILYK